MEFFNDCLVRELKEETGIEISYEERIPYLTIKYLCKDYPSYYSKINLTENEKEGMFELKYIPKSKVLKILEESLKTRKIKCRLSIQLKQ